MIVPLNINLSDLQNSLSLSKNEVEDIIDFTVKEVTAQFAKTWEQVALRDLNSTRSRYVNNLKLIDEGRLKGAVVLDYSQDPLVRMIEEGATAFDMKVYFAKSSKKTMKADGGWYLTIPFSWGTPGSLRENFSNVMPTDIHKIAKSKAFNESIQQADLSQQRQIDLGVRAKIEIPKSKVFEEYVHKSSVYQGITKKQDSKTGQTSYVSFRRVSDNSDANSWIHPGFEAKNLAEKALGEFEGQISTITSKAIDDILNNLGY